MAFLVATVVVAGWRLFWFLTDDAFIAFRYARNSMEGLGWVWNPPPFQPVEGYTSFLWLVVLETVWRALGVAPPEAANWLGLGFGLLGLIVVARCWNASGLPAPVTPHRQVLLAVALLTTATNRTFLTWLSSGLETSLWNLLSSSWLAAALAATRGHRTRVWLAATASLLALTRPDGLLFAAATVCLLLLPLAAPRESLSADRAARLRRLGLETLPLWLVPAHLVWRRWTYGAWLPNTYYAKVVGIWPESGLRYLGCFLLENGLWVWLILAALWLVKGCPGFPEGGLAGARGSHLVALGTILAHVGYYVVVVGGDHFEYRVFSYLIPWLLVSAAWMAAWTTRSARVSIALGLTLMAASWPIQWTHWSETHGLRTRYETYKLTRPIAPLFPRPIRPILEWWDEQQAWLIARNVAMRHQEHKVFFEDQTEQWPPDNPATRLRWEDRPVLATNTIGVPGWVLDDVAIIDMAGLTDRVVARTPVVAGKERNMAHDRWPPPGYVECFRPNVEYRWREEVKIVVRARSRPLTDEEIMACESRDWSR
jgi:arabinofuranosyltransferase